MKIKKWIFPALGVQMNNLLDVKDVQISKEIRQMVI